MCGGRGTRSRFTILGSMKIRTLDRITNIWCQYPDLTCLRAIIEVCYVSTVFNCTLSGVGVAGRLHCIVRGVWGVGCIKVTSKWRPLFDLYNSISILVSRCEVFYGDFHIHMFSPDTYFNLLYNMTVDFFSAGAYVKLFLLVRLIPLVTEWPDISILVSRCGAFYGDFHIHMFSPDTYILICCIIWQLTVFFSWRLC